MITGDIKNQIDRIWDSFWSGGISNPLEVIEQITYLLFLRRLDDMHTLEESKANRLKKPMERRVFPEGKDGRGQSYEDFRWSRFKHAFWLLRDASVEEGFHMNPPPPDWDGLSEEALGFVATERRPPDYPADVPFLGHSAAIVNPTTAGFAVLWMSCPNPLLGFREILDQSRASDWEGPSGKEVPMATQEDREAELRKPGRVRRVCLRILGSRGAWYLTLRDEVER